ncbi:Esterase/lipase/thioesterase [Candidatus Terasakiella magnetica]|nr:Esterase/lipase/thioesterase [Candidatus Terasakiella magnetica]
MKRRTTSLFLALAFPALAGCATIDRDVNADSIAGPVGLKRMIVKTDPFVLTTFARIRDPGQPVTVYIEGDGLAWLSRSEVSLDPTPREAMGLALAAADPTPNVVYLARPCQFTARAKNPTCGIAYWTGKRFSPEVVASMNQAVDQIAAQVPGQKINLVGYSGGGAVAVLVAAGRKDVGSIRTVAGNLDHAEVNRLAKVSQLSGSINAIDVAAQVAKIPQIHFSGAADTTVPPVIAERFAGAVGTSCARIKVVPGATHETGWRERWRELQGLPLGC